MASGKPGAVQLAVSDRSILSEDKAPSSLPRRADTATGRPAPSRSRPSQS